MLSRKKWIALLFFYFGFTVNTFAHEGHDLHPSTAVTIEKQTYIHLQSILLTYQYVYSHFAKDDPGGITGLSQRLIDAARQGIQSEPEGPGQHVMQHICEGAEGLKKAKNIQELHTAFASISNALFQFFESQPNQLMRNRLKLCRCKNGHQWLQPENYPTACPYSLNKSSDCLLIVETKY